MMLDRRELIAGGSLLAALALPRPAEASYALYKASQDTYTERKATGYVPVAVSDRESLAAIQAGIARKRPSSQLKVKKAPQYCAGQTSGVQPMLENICANIGISKADQSNSQVDQFGNMAIGENLQSADYKRYLKAQEQAADAERLRRLSNR